MLGRLLCIGLVIASFSICVKAESTKNCGSGYIDIVDWLTLDDDLRATKHMSQPNEVGHPIYTALWPDKFWWIKTVDGNTWDINTFDDNYVYWWINSWGEWGHPDNYNMASTGVNFVAAPRCVPDSGYPSTNIVNTNSDNDRYEHCVWQDRSNLLNTAFSVWGPYYLSFGGDLPNDMPTYVLSYSWNCDDTFLTCEKEVYYLSQRYGLVGYEYYQNVDHSTGAVELRQSTVWNTVANGSVSPNFSCF
jgi:hypothetical protein